MAEDKKGFLMYADQREQFDQLTDEQAGRLVKHLFAYVNDEDPDPDDIVIKLSFTPIKSQLKRDLDKWGKTRQGRSVAGKASAKARKEKKYSEATNSTNVESVEQIQQTSTNPTVSVNANVSVNENVNDSVNVIVNDNDTKVKVYAEDVHDTFKDCLLFFPNHLHPKNANSWLDVIDKLISIDKIPKEQILEIVEKTRLDPFWSKNFLSLTKLRKTNGEGVKYIIVFNENLKSKSNGKKQVTSEDLANAHARLRG